MIDINKVNLDDLDLSSLPEDVRKELLKVDVMHTQNKFKVRLKMILWPLSKLFGPSL